MYLTSGNAAYFSRRGFHFWRSKEYNMVADYAFADETTLTSRANPASVRGAQNWTRIGDPAPTDPNELTLLATDTHTPYVTNIDGADGNKVAHYMLRWKSTRGDVGPWSETASATIGA